MSVPCNIIFKINFEKYPKEQFSKDPVTWARACSVRQSDQQLKLSSEVFKILSQRSASLTI